MMTNPKTVLLLNGSPKCELSNSRVIGKFLADKLVEKGLQSAEEFVVRAINSPEGTERLQELIQQADIVILTTPLYIDSLPSFTIKAMETICEQRKRNPQARTQLLVPVMNSGFPEKEHMNVALQIIQNFAKEANFQWGGKVRVGMGGALNGEPLREGKGMTGRLTRGLTLAAAALAEGNPIPSEIEVMIAKPFLPIFLVKIGMGFFGKQMWNSQAKNNLVDNRMLARPYDSM